MGASSSVLLSEENSRVIEEDQFNSQRNVSNRSTRKKNQQVFERSTSIMSNTDMIDELDGDEVSPDMREILVKALSGFLFLQSGMIKDNPKLNLLIKGMKQESFSTGHNVITEGESGYKLYVIESGEVEVTINGTIIRDLNRGCLLGELALLYDAPRSATVKCKNNCVLWSLTRDIFKRIQTISATANQIQRARWLVASPELACLSAVDLSRLVGTLQIIEFEQGSTVFTEGEITNQIILIENGHCSISIKGDSIKATDKDYKMIDKKLNILRPMGSKKRMSFDHMNNSQLKSFLRDSNPDTILINSENGSTSMSHPPNTVCEVSEGCIVGIGALRGKAQMTNETCWKWMKHEKVEGAISPLTMTALTPITCAVFSVEIFENLFGPIVEVLKKYGSKNVLTGEVEMEKPNTKEMIFDSSKFKQKYILGSGSFGVVTLGEYRAEKNSSAPPMLCALKALSKLAVIETGQLRWVEW